MSESHSPVSGTCASVSNWSSRDVGHADLVDLGRVDVDVDELRIGRERADLAGDAVGETRAAGDDEVRAVERHVGVLRAVHADEAHVERVRGGNGAEAHERGGYRDPQALRKLFHKAGSARRNGSTAHEEHGPARLADKRGCRFHLFGITAVRGFVRRDVDLVRVLEHGFLTRNVGGDVHEHRTWSPGFGDVERLAYAARYVASGLHEEAVLHDGNRDAEDVGLLEGVSSDHGQGHLPRYDDEGNGVHVGSGNARHGVRGTRAARDERDAHLAGCARIAVSFMDGALLVAGKHVLVGLGIEQGVIDVDGMTARVSEDEIDALSFKRCDDGLRAGHPLALLGIART